MDGVHPDRHRGLGNGDRGAERDDRRLEDGRILSVDLWRFRGREGIEIDRELPTLYAFRDGLIVRIDGFTDQAEAFEAAGLSE